MMKQVEADIIATIYMYDSSVKNAKPKQMPIPPHQYSCPMFFDDEESGFDCRLLLDQIEKSIGPGEKIADVPIKFLFYDLVKSKIKVGKQFKLWDMGLFAEGKITKIL